MSVPLSQVKKRDHHESNGTKRKASNHNHYTPTSQSTGAQRKNKRQKTRDARTVAAQTTTAAFHHGELNLDTFVRAREYEISALEAAFATSKSALNRRAFQQVPFELRRRGAAHNANKLPRNKRQRARREMRDDNTPRVTARRRKPSGRGRLRLDTAAKLRIRASQPKKVKRRTLPSTAIAVLNEKTGKSCSIPTRQPRVKKNVLARAPLPKARFRKRQRNKTWLPTHLFHTKRAHMAVHWRFALPVTPTGKSYRPTHRASGERGAIAWDMSYVSTIALSGFEKSLLAVIRSMCIGTAGKDWTQGDIWWEGWAYDDRQDQHSRIAPVQVIWCPCEKEDNIDRLEHGAISKGKQGVRRHLFVRVHPSAFLEVWERLLSLAKVQSPVVTVEDLRYEIGSLQVTGPLATEAIRGVLWASSQDVGATAEAKQSDANDPKVGTTARERLWMDYGSNLNPTVLPINTIIPLTIDDPRLHHPPLTQAPTHHPQAHTELLDALASWPGNEPAFAQSIFSRLARRTAEHRLPSQKAISRRKSLAAPGGYPPAQYNDPRIPLLLLASRDPARSNGTWTVLLPWNAVKSVWSCLMYYPLSTGGTVRLGGLDQLHQVAFEASQPSFPGDFPGTSAGWAWEMAQRAVRGNKWARKPRGRRIEFENLVLGQSEPKGELGLGWACDWERLLLGKEETDLIRATDVDSVEDQKQVEKPQKSGQSQNENAQKKKTPKPKSNVHSTATMPEGLTQLSVAEACKYLLSSSQSSLTYHGPHNALFPVRIIYLARGTPSPCARVYRLPAASNLTSTLARIRWLQVLPPLTSQARQAQRNTRRATLDHRQPLQNLPRTATQRDVQRALATVLLAPPHASGDDSPDVPSEDALTGFVTSGAFNLANGKGIAIGNLLLRKVINTKNAAQGNDVAMPDASMEQDQAAGAKEKQEAASRLQELEAHAKRHHLDPEKLCIVRDAGQRAGRLAVWHVV